MISNFNEVSLPEYFTEFIRENTFEHLKASNVIIDEENTFYIIIFTGFIQFFKEFAVKMLKRLDIDLIDYYTVILDKVIKVNNNGDITVHYRYDKNLSKIDNIKCALMKTKDKETIETLKNCLKRESSEVNDN